jgi:hypothetical protein
VTVKKKISKKWSVAELAKKGYATNAFSMGKSSI